MLKRLAHVGMERQANIHTSYMHTLFIKEFQETKHVAGYQMSPIANTLLCTHLFCMHLCCQTQDIRLDL